MSFSFGNSSTAPATGFGGAAKPSFSFGSTNTATTATAGFGGFGTSTSSSGFGTFGTATSTATPFGGVGTTPATTTSLFSGFGTNTAKPTTGFGTTGAFGTNTFGTTPAFGNTATTFGNTFGTSTFGTGSTFGSTFGKPATTSGFTGFGTNLGSTSTFGQQQTQLQIQQPQQPQGPTSPHEALVAAVFNCNVFGDERDQVLAKWNLLQAKWGVGQAYYSRNAPPLELNEHNPLCRFKAVGYSRLSVREDKDGHVNLLFNKPEQEIKTNQQALTTSLMGLLGNKPNLAVNIESVKAVSENKTQVVIVVVDKSTGRGVPVSASEVCAHVGAGAARAALAGAGCAAVAPLARPAPHLLDLYLQTPPPGMDKLLWRQAQVDNPDPENYIPIPIVGFSEIKFRSRCQSEQAALQAGWLREARAELDALRTRRAAAAAALERRAATLHALRHTLLQIVASGEVVRRAGSALGAGEEAARARLQELAAHLAAPPLYNFVLAFTNMVVGVPVASPPGGAGAAREETPHPPPPPAPRNGTPPKQGSLTIVRRSSTRCKTESPAPTDEQLDQLDLDTDNLPAIDTPDACDKAALRLRYLLRQLNRGEISAETLQKNLHYAARVLEAVYIDETKPAVARQQSAPTLVFRRLADEDDELSEVQPDAVPPEVREWLASTFTRQLATSKRKSDEKPKFRSVAHAIRAGIFVDRIYRRVTSTALMQFPQDVVRVLKTLDEWSFDVFALHEAAIGAPVKYLGYELLNRYGMIHKFKVPPTILENFLSRIEEGYCKFQNPYHNNLHAADVAQTVHYMLCQTGLMNWLSDLEIFATLVAAVVHDFEHTGTTNNFHVMSGSDTALLYNDRAVLENHHISAAFRLMRDEECNILQNLSRDEFREFRTLVIDMVLATDMSFHFQQLKNMRSLLSLAEPTVDKSKAASLVLHCCDISHPAKRWDLHHRWTMSLLDEFFLQGDKERELGLPFSPLCDRNNTLVAESQIGFIEFIVEPSMAVCADMLECVLGPLHSNTKNTNAKQETVNEESQVKIVNENPKFKIKKPWIACLSDNKKIWKEQATKDAEVRAKQEEESNNPVPTTEE